MKYRVAVREIFNIFKCKIILLIILSQNMMAQKWHLIPSRVINVYELIDDTSRVYNSTVEEFEVSDFVSLKDYKSYLKSIKKDSSKTFYLSQLPDSNILRDKRDYRKYLKYKKYEKHPAVGISWENAINYCKWKNIQDNSTKNNEFIYRVPELKEWYIAYRYLDVRNLHSDFNYKYSEWLINEYYENMFRFMEYIAESPVKYDTSFNYENTDFDYYSRISRKLVVGNSFLSQGTNYNLLHRVFYANQGYRYVAFRIIRKKNVR